MKKKVLIDARMVGVLGHGIGNYVLDLALALRGRDLPFELHYLLAKDAPAKLRELPHRDSAISFLHPLEAWRLPKELEGFNLFHSPSFMSLTRYPCPHVQTVHDLNHLQFGNPLHKLYYKKLLLPSLRNAKTIASVSEAAAWELRTWLDRHEVKKPVLVVPNAIAPLPAPEKGALESLGLKEFFFCLSNPKPHKNTAMLETAHHRAWSRGDCLPLVTNVSGAYQEGIFRVGAVSNERVSALFAGAKGFFFPSLYEGFGRAPVEAALAGCAPVASDIPAHREVLAGVKEAQFVAPQDTHAWEEMFLRLSQSPRRKVSGESQEWIRRTYSLDQLGDKMEKIYRDALS